MKVFRLDLGRLDAPTKTSQGFLKAPAHLTRAGVFTYYNADGSQRREYRPASEVLKSDSLATLISAPVTALHPAEMVTAANRGKYDRGNVGDNIVRDGSKVAATLYVKDGKLISAIERGDMAEVSCGYTCDMDMTPGVVPAGEPDAGAKYDAVQSSISYNHVAIVPKGRAGTEIRMHLDAAGDAVRPHFDANNQEQDMIKERIDGVDYEVGTDPHKAAVLRRDEAAKQAKADADAKQALLDKAQADLAAAKKKLDELPAQLEQQATARATLMDGARKVLGAEAKFDGKDDAAIRKEVAQHANPDLKLDGKSADYITALFDIAVGKGEAHEDGADELAQLRQDAIGRRGGRAREDAVSAYARDIEESEQAGRDMWRSTEPA